MKTPLEFGPMASLRRAQEYPTLVFRANVTFNPGKNDTSSAVNDRRKTDLEIYFIRGADAHKRENAPRLTMTQAVRLFLV